MSLLALLLVAAGAQQAAGSDSAPGHWPQWRGPNRDNVSTETGLLKEWPDVGPKQLWKSEKLGEGVGGIAVAGGLVFLMGYKSDAEYLTALDGAGTTVWSERIGPLVGEQSVMRWLSQRTPVVDDDRVYAFTAEGILLCLESGTGKLLWKKDYRREFGGARGRWGFCDFPLVDGERLICTPGGPTNTVVALDKRGGKLLWSRALAECKEGSHSAVAIAELAGVRQYIHHLDFATVGISVAEGNLLWSYSLGSRMGDVHTDVTWKSEYVFTLTGWGIGGALLKIEREGDRLTAVEKYKNKYSFASWLGNTVRSGNHLYSFNGPALCVDLETGKTLVSESIGITSATVTHADGLFYVRGQRGEHALVKAAADGIKTISRFGIPKGKEPPWTFPVVAGGRLYLRDQAELSCYDVRGPGYRELPPVWSIPVPKRPLPPAKDPAPPPKPVSAAAFVATPQDVVERMLDEARVTDQDVLVDLGSGDGRIVITAFKKYGCRTVGYEIDPRLVELSRAEIKKGKIETWVKIEEKDLFTADLSGASVVTLYLGAPNNAKLIPQLMKLKPGSRIISHAHLLGDAGPKPDKEIKIVSQEDQVEHTIYVWTAPLGKGAK